MEDLQQLQQQRGLELLRARVEGLQLGEEGGVGVVCEERGGGWGGEGGGEEFPLFVGGGGEARLRDSGVGGCGIERRRRSGGWGLGRGEGGGKDAALRGGGVDARACEGGADEVEDGVGREVGGARGAGAGEVVVFAQERAAVREGLRRV